MKNNNSDDITWFLRSEKSRRSQASSFIKSWLTAHSTGRHFRWTLRDGTYFLLVSYMPVVPRLCEGDTEETIIHFYAGSCRAILPTSIPICTNVSTEENTLKSHQKYSSVQRKRGITDSGAAFIHSPTHTGKHDEIVFIYTLHYHPLCVNKVFSIYPRTVCFVYKT